MPREWQRAFYNFDNTPWSFVTLFVVATREGWPKVLWSTIDSGEFEEGKLDEGETEEGWFFLFFLYIVAVSFFLINMFTGILYQQFSRIRNELNASQFLTRDQRNWVAAQKTPTLTLTLTLTLTPTLTLTLTLTLTRWPCRRPCSGPSSPRYQSSPPTTPAYGSIGWSGRKSSRALSWR